MKANQIARFEQLDNDLAVQRHILGLIDKQPPVYWIGCNGDAVRGVGNYGASYNTSSAKEVDADLVKIIRPIHRAMTLERIALIEAELKELDR